MVKQHVGEICVYNSDKDKKRKWSDIKKYEGLLS